MKVLIVVVGRVRSPLEEAVQEYEGRAGRYWKLEVTEVAAGTRGTGSAGDAEAVKAAEGERILGAIPPGATVVALTREGRSMSSDDLARFLGKAALNSVGCVAFVIGGAFGLSDAVLERAQRRLSLSGMTLPHEMARLFLAEQLYRAGTIQRGEPYHKGGGKG